MSAAPQHTPRHPPPRKRARTLLTLQAGFAPVPPIPTRRSRQYAAACTSCCDGDGGRQQTQREHVGSSQPFPAPPRRSRPRLGGVTDLKQVVGPRLQVQLQ
jgi:hypothetical protein